MADATISAAGLRIVKLLIGNPPQTVTDLLGAAGVTRTAVTEQLNELIEAGFVERSTERLTGRGRPRHRYKATNAALVLLFASNQRLVVPAIWRAIRDVGGEDLSLKILKQVSQLIAEHYSSQITAKKPQARLQELIKLLEAEGGLIEASQGKDGQLVLYKRSCPFVSMVDDHRSVCYIDQEALSAIVGRPVRQTACRHDGDPCCAFEIIDG
jgi:predicted ArsR family transcriptional regulator